MIMQFAHILLYQDWRRIYCTITKYIKIHDTYQLYVSEECYYIRITVVVFPPFSIPAGSGKSDLNSRGNAGKFRTLISYQNNEILDLELGPKCEKAKFSSKKAKIFLKMTPPFLSIAFMHNFFLKKFKQIFLQKRQKLTIKLQKQIQLFPAFPSLKSPRECGNTVHCNQVQTVDTFFPIIVFYLLYICLVLTCIQTIVRSKKNREIDFTEKPIQK